MPIILAKVMSMISQLWAPHQLYRGWPLNSQCFAQVGPTLVSEWQAHAHQTHEAHRGSHECLLAGTVSRPSYLWDGNIYIGKVVSLFLNALLPLSSGWRHSWSHLLHKWGHPAFHMHYVDADNGDHDPRKHQQYDSHIIFPCNTSTLRYGGAAT